jgi:hypothetical protein
LPESEIKNEDERLHLVQYLEKNRPMIHDRTQFFF